MLPSVPHAPAPTPTAPRAGSGIISPSGFPLPEVHSQPLGEVWKPGPVFDPSLGTWLESPEGPSGSRTESRAGVPASHRRECTHRPAAPPPRSPRRRVPASPRPRAHCRRTARVRQPRRPLGDRPAQRGRGRLQARSREIAAGPAQSARSPQPAAPALGALPGDPQLRAPAAGGGADKGRGWKGAGLAAAGRGGGG